MTKYRSHERTVFCYIRSKNGKNHNQEILSNYQAGWLFYHTNLELYLWIYYLCLKLLIPLRGCGLFESHFFLFYLLFFEKMNNNIIDTFDYEKLSLQIINKNQTKRLECFENAYLETLEFMKNNPKFSYSDFLEIKNIFEKTFYSRIFTK